MNNYIVGIIGNGFVGESQAFAFSPTNEIRIFDVDKLKSTHTFDEVCESDFVFICVPTPMKDGKHDLSYIKSVFSKAKKGPIYIIKSTVLPGTTEALIKEFEQDIIFSPEFLTQRTAKLDMLTQARVVLGGGKAQIGLVRKLYEDRFMNRNYIETDSTTAEFIKYMNNTFFATKISVMNEFHRLGEKIGVDWGTALNGFVSDGRIGDSHLHVPGPDGKLGFGGACFPKDLNAMIELGEKHGVNMNVLEAAWKTNLEVRKE
tara:strand:+ start:4028 stop:4807 length:780 start_codon:yes stop_codon:yes gene_type:complete